MREIKFRAFVRGYIVSVKGIDFINKYITWDDNQYDRSVPPNKCYEIESFDNIILMQYTGLKDKNGKEIYEGDILKYIFWHKAGIAKVTFENGGFGLSEYDSHFEFDCFMPFNGWDEPDVDLNPFIEIIGNIYENPELLNREQNVQVSDTTESESGDES